MDWLADNGMRLKGRGYDAVGALVFRWGGFFTKSPRRGECRHPWLRPSLTPTIYLLVILRTRAQQALIAHAAYIPLPYVQYLYMTAVRVRIATTTANLDSSRGMKVRDINLSDYLLHATSSDIAQYAAVDR